VRVAGRQLALPRCRATSELVRLRLQPRWSPVARRCARPGGEECKVPTNADRATSLLTNPAVRTGLEAHVRCVQKVKAQGGYTTSKLDPFHINKFQRRHHKIYPTYAYGGSHVLSANVLRWWTANPWTLTYDVTWMEDVAFGEPIFWWILQCQH
jgi:hypothetical protein